MRTLSEDASGFSDSVVAKKHDEEEDGAEGGMKHYFRIFTFMSATDVVLNIVGGVCAIGAGVTQPLTALVFGAFTTKFTDFGSGRSTPADFREDVESFTLWFVYLFVAKLAFLFISGVIFTITALRTTKTMRSTFVRAILRQDISFIDALGPGAVAVKATTNANAINAGISTKLAHLIQSTATIIAAMVVGCWQSWQLMLIVFAVVVPFFIILPVTMTGEANVDARMLQIYSQASNLAEEMLGSIKTVHAFGASSLLLERFDQFLESASKVGKRKGPILAVMYGADFFFSSLPYSVAFWQGTRMYISGEVPNAGALWTVVFAVLMIATGLAQIAPSTSAFSQASSASSELFGILDREPLLDTTSDDDEKPEPVVGNIEFHEVKFSYPSRPDVPVLKGISFQCPANKVTALVGASGSGKSTIVSLLERWYEPSQGYVSLDGRRIDHLNVRWLRSQLRLVQQEPVLFNDTIFNNVSQGLSGTKHEFADQESKEKLVIAACNAANAAEFIENLPEGYHTNVGERAGLLSGGQKQRIAIARSIISNPPILLLDEATSALDAHSEGVVQAALNNVSRSRTTLVIAHKLATVMKADNIIVLDQGEIVEQGSHHELLSRNGRYAALVKAQDMGTTRDTAGPSMLDGEKISMAVQARTFNGDAALISEKASHLPVEEHSDQAYQGSFVRLLATFLGENGQLWPQFLVCIIVSVIGGAVYPAQAIILTRLVTAFELPIDQLYPQVKFFAGMLFMVAGVSMISYAIMGYVTNTISQVRFSLQAPLTMADLVQILTRRYRLELLHSMLQQDIAFFDKPENAAASLASRLSTAPTGLQELLGANVAFILVIFVNLTSCVALAIAHGWKLGLVVSCTIPLIFGSGVVRLRVEMASDDQNAAVYAESARFASQAVAAMRTVVSFAIEHAVWREYDLQLIALLKKSYGTVATSMISYAMAGSLDLLVMALAFWYGGKLLADGEYTTEQFYIIYLSVVFGGEAAGQFFAYTTSISKALAGGNYILGLRHSKAIIADDPGARDPDPTGGFEFDDVSFLYPLRPDVPVLQSLELEIKPQLSVAFVGGSGSGKSTTIGLLERYYDPSSGQLRFGGEPLPRLRLSTYRSCLALVSQEPTLYQGSIRDNIALGAVGLASAEQVEQAAKDANILDFIKSLPQGMDTDCGTKGTELSGGQKQRISIARALIRNPKVLLLDEATSALDSTSEKLVQEALQGVAGGRTVISVAHRLSTIRDCDRIFVLENGCVAESGSHEELLALGGSYKKLCDAQCLGG